MAKKKLRIVGTQEQIEAAKIILNESLFGPEDLKEGMAEREYLKVRGQDGKPLTLDDFAEFIPLGNNKEAVIDGVKIINLGEGVYRVVEDSEILGNIDTSAFIPPVVFPETFKSEPLERPIFGVTFVGTSSGFDPMGRTTSWILWAGKKGIFIDPLNDPVAELNKLGIESSDVPYVLLTHCHADHDSGVLKRVLNGQKVKLITSKAIYESFLRKAKAYTGGIDVSDFIEFIEANPGSTIAVNGLKLKISSAFHSIPTIRFVAEYTKEEPDGQVVKKSLAYSADTFFDPTKLEELSGQGILSKQRLQELLDFVLKCEADILVHEAGMPPIHTPDKALEGAVADAGRVDLLGKTILVHTGKASPGVNLKVAKAGDTIPLIRSGKSDLEHIQAIASNPILGNLPLSTAIELAGSSQIVAFKPGDKIIRKDEYGDKFYIIINGKVSVKSDNKIVATLGKGDYFGEAALLTGKPRNATIEAISSSRVLVVDREQFEKIIGSDELKTSLKNILEARPVLSQIKFLRGLETAQLNSLASKLQIYHKVQKGDKLIEQGQVGEAFYVIKSGQVKVTVKNQDGKERMVATLGEGDVFGEISLLEGIPCTAAVEVITKEAEVLKMAKVDFIKLSKEIPSFTFHLLEIAKERKKGLTGTGDS
jgi:CRP-like cAMP-binding protein